MKIYNTLTRQIDPLTPLKDGTVGVYTCGPTVYDYLHIGNWYNYIRMDLLIRALRSEGLTVNWVMNITDVGHLVSDADDGEDKLEKGARREGKSAWDVAAYYTADFLEIMSVLNITAPDKIVKATDHITEQIELILQLREKGFTYEIEDGVYFDTSLFPEYASFARLDLDEQQTGARVGINDQKRNPADFALWKFSPEDHQRDMEWDSPFGNGRKGFPGWHIECSAMSMKYLGVTFDIHTGGIDHIPVHHTNEIAQSEAATGQRLANYWFHSNHVTVNGEKISKSLGNGIRVQEITAKGIPAAAIRLNVLESHYRSQSKFSWESLAAAANRLNHWHAVCALRYQLSFEMATDSLTRDVLGQTRQSIAEAVADDLNMPRVVSLIDQAMSHVEVSLLSAESLQSFLDFIRYVDDVTGLTLTTDVLPAPEAVEQLIADRSEARAQKDWLRSDVLRDQLDEVGYGVTDHNSGKTLWFKK